MPVLEVNQYAAARPLFENLGAFHLSALSVIEGTAPGELWVDDAAHPRVGLLEGPEGTYLAGTPAGTPAADHCFAALKEVIPFFAYLIIDPPAWEPLLPQVWNNSLVRRHPREHYVWRNGTVPSWRERIPEGYEMVRVDEAFLQRAGLINLGAVADWIDDGWISREVFFEHGAGFCLVQGDTIASWSLMDCFCGERCEMGIHTDPAHRRKGLGALVCSATLEAALARGYREVGWHCLSGNQGSKGIARKLGFVKERDYLAFSSGMPAENPTDLTPAEYEDWALHYERARDSIPWTALSAAQAWVQAGQLERALENLRFLQQAGWKGRPEWLTESWLLAPVRDLPEFKALLEALL